MGALDLPIPKESRTARLWNVTNNSAPSCQSHCAQHQRLMCWAEGTLLASILLTQPIFPAAVLHSMSRSQIKRCMHTLSSTFEHQIDKLLADFPVQCSPHSQRERSELTVQDGPVVGPQVRDGKVNGVGHVLGAEVLPGAVAPVAGQRRAPGVEGRPQAALGPKALLAGCHLRQEMMSTPTGAPDCMKQAFILVRS
jgi:hypothetical protein